MRTKSRKKILKALEKKLEEHHPVFRARIVAAVIINGKIVAYGKNQNKTHPVAARYSKHKEAIYLHAEVDAIHKAKRKYKDLSKAEIFVLRKHNNGNYGICAPCSGCIRCIVENNITKITYSNAEGNLECIS